MGTTNILDLNNRVSQLEQSGGGGDTSALANKSDIATEFSATTAYTAGCFVYYEGKLYQFNADHAAGAWDPTDVVEANVTDQVVSNASAIAGLTASDVAYDNTDSGLTATDVQGAVDELAESYPATQVMMSDGVTSVEDAISTVDTYNLTLTGFASPITLQRVGRVVYITYNGNVTNLPAGSLSFSNVIPEKYRPAEATQFFSISAADSYTPPVMLRLSRNGVIDGYNYRGAISASTSCRFGTMSYIANS